MGGTRMTGIILGIGYAILIMVAYPYIQPVLESVVEIVIDGTSPTAFEEFILDTLPFWGLIAAFVGALVIAIKGSRHD